MSDTNPYLDALIDEAKQLGTDWDTLFTGKFEVKEIFDLIATLVRLAEAIISAPSSGADKHQLVRDAFTWFDNHYHILDRVDDLIPLPFILEPWDGPVIRKVVDFLISQAVTVFNLTIWKDEGEAIPTPSTSQG